MPDEPAPTAKRRRANPSLPDSATCASQAKWFRKPSVVWFRGNDLRVEDHPALLAAAQRGGPVVPLFIWDEEDQFGRILGDMKRWWLRQSLKELANDFRNLGVQLYTREGRCTVVLREFIAATGADAVFWNRCYEPELLQRDEEMRVELAQEGLVAESFKAELLVEPWEISSSDSAPMFKTFHEYMRAWMLFPPPPHPFPCPARMNSLQSLGLKVGSIDELNLEYPKELGARLAENWIPGSAQAKTQLENFLRDVFPVFGEGKYRRHNRGSSRLSPHIRFGELSPRRMYHATRLRVSRWRSGTPLPIAAALGLSNLYRSGDTTKSLLPVKQNAGTRRNGSGSDSSAYSSQNPNFAVQRKERDRVEPTADVPPAAPPPTAPPTRDPSPDGDQRKPTPSSTASHERDRSSDGSQEQPHINYSARAFLKNLCLRDYSYHVLFHHPEFSSKPVVPEFVQFPWAKDNGSFNAWKYGKTGYPIVDAAMRELRQTGWIHNSMRFLLACFLTKYLLLPWTRGLKEFYMLLLDGDHAANSLGWQWTSGSNTDSFPFSCLLNPVTIGTQQDPSGDYVRKWVPELAHVPREYLHQPWKAPSNVLLSAGVKYGESYPLRIVESGRARKRAKEAMLFMKQVFAAMRPNRTLTSLPLESLVKEWPPDCVAEEEVKPNDSKVDKTGLMPSLWSLFDDPNLLACGDLGDTAHELGSVTDPPELSVDNGDSMEQALLNAHTLGIESELMDTMDYGGRRGGFRNKEPDSRNGSGSQDEIMPTSPETQVHAHPNPNTVSKGNEIAEAVPQSGAAQLTVNASMPQLSGLPHGAPQRIWMPMHQNQLHQTASPVVYDPIYGSGITPAPRAPIPVTNFQLMMSTGHANGEVIGGPASTQPEISNRAMYPQHMMYGIPFNVMPQRAEPDHHTSTPLPTVSSAPATTRQVNVTPSPNLCIPYGMYGNRAYEHAPANTPLNIATQPTVQQVMHRPGPHVLPHPVLIPQAAGVDQLHVNGAVYGSAVQSSPQPPGYATIAPNGHAAGPNGHSATVRSSAQQAPANGDYTNKREIQTHQTDATPSSQKPAEVKSSPRRPRSSLKRGQGVSRTITGAIAKQSVNNQRGVPKSPGRVRSPAQGRSKSTRGRRSSGIRGGRSRADTRGSSTVGANATGSGSNSLREAAPTPLTLEEKRVILTRISEQEDHEYYHFAKYLTKTYDLTTNTDQKTSKDFVRLCTLKDSYHKQCNSEKDKLKIYSIKAFFSKILRLEVTGEWDRHNHGGLRGPYAYGLKPRSINQD